MISDKWPGHIWEVQQLNKMTGRVGTQNVFLSLDYFYFIGKRKDLCLYLMRIISDQDEKNQILMTNIWLNLVSVCNQAKWSNCVSDVFISPLTVCSLGVTLCYCVWCQPLWTEATQALEVSIIQKERWGYLVLWPCMSSMWPPHSLTEQFCQIRLKSLPPCLF